MASESFLGEEFFDTLEKSKAKNGCIMLPGHIQYWRPNNDQVYAGTKDILIDEPVHFAGPSPDAPLDS